MRFYFGASLNVDVIDLEQSIHGGGWSPSGNNISLPLNYFTNSNECEELNLSDPAIYSVFAHEALHVWQRQHGRDVTSEAIPLQLGRFFSFGTYDPYDYDDSISDPSKLLGIFKSGSVEQQGSIFQDYVYRHQLNLIEFQKQSGIRYRVNKFLDIADYVYWK